VSPQYGVPCRALGNSLYALRKAKVDQDSRTADLALGRLPAIAFVQAMPGGPQKMVTHFRMSHTKEHLGAPAG
jgi:hypothetical protein